MNGEQPATATPAVEAPELEITQLRPPKKHWLPNKLRIVICIICLVNLGVAGYMGHKLWGEYSLAKASSGEGLTNLTGKLPGQPRRRPLTDGSAEAQWRTIKNDQFGVVLDIPVTWQIGIPGLSPTSRDCIDLEAEPAAAQFLNWAETDGKDGFDKTGQIDGALLVNLSICPSPAGGSLIEFNPGPYFIVREPLKLNAYFSFVTDLQGQRQQKTVHDGLYLNFLSESTQGDDVRYVIATTQPAALKSDRQDTPQFSNEDGLLIYMKFREQNDSNRVHVAYDSLVNTTVFQEAVAIIQGIRNENE